MKRRLFILVPVVLALTLLMGVDSWRKVPIDWIWLDQARHELFAIFDVPAVQWMWALGCGIYLAWFAFLQWQLNRRTQSLVGKTGGGRDSSLGDRSGLLLAGLAAWAAAAYAWHHSEDSATTDFAVFLVGITIAQSVAILKSWRRSCADTDSVLTPCLSCLIIILTAAAIYFPDTQWGAQYRGATRWSGPWNDPNRSGLMMGVGTVIALGIAVSRLGSPVAKISPKVQSQDSGNLLAGSMVRKHNSGSWRWVGMIFWLMAAAAMAVELVRTYSRGSWLGTLLGLGYLGYFWWKMKMVMPGWLQWIHRHLPCLAVIGFSVGMLAYWDFRSTEQRIVRRAFSVANQNDFSWRNRLAAYEGALQIMVDHPLLGWGWDTPKIVYNNFYKPMELTEGKALELNDYFTLGMTLGLPALACLIWYIFRRFRPSNATGDSANPEQNAEFPGLRWFETTCRAGVVVLLVGFWFERALCFMGTGAVFWILLELGRQDQADSIQ